MMIEWKLSKIVILCVDNVHDDDTDDFLEK